MSMSTGGQYYTRDTLRDVQDKKWEENKNSVTVIMLYP